MLCGRTSGPEIVHFGGINGPSYRKTHWASPPPFPMCFAVGGGRLDPKSKRFPARSHNEATESTLSALHSFSSSASTKVPQLNPVTPMLNFVETPRGAVAVWQSVKTGACAWGCADPPLCTDPPRPTKIEGP